MGRTGQQMRSRTSKAMKQSAAPARPKAIRPPSRTQRLRYAFDNSMSRGTPALVAWLALVTFALIMLFSLVLLVTHLSPADGGERPGFFRQLFISLMHALDPGTVAGDTGTWRYLVTMLVLTVAGLFIVSALIGVIATGIDAKLVDLRRGRSLVIESDHTVILGWSEAVFTIVRELSIANESRRRPVVVVMSEHDKVEMEDELREKVPDLRGTRVVCRTGSPIDVGDLALASLRTARSVIVLSPSGEDPDSEVIKTLLSLSHAFGDDGPHVVAEIQDPSNLEAARMVGRDRAVILNKQETIARLIVQTSRQSGAAAVYTELFDFDGDEIYFHTDATLDGSTYADAQRAYAEVTVIGLVEESGAVRLNPPRDTVIAGQELVVIVSDDSALVGAARSSAAVDEAVIVTSDGPRDLPSRALVLGWNQRAASVIRELDNYAEPGSELVIATEHGEPALPPLGNLTATVMTAPTSDRATLEGLEVPGFDQVIVLSYSDHLPIQRADARTLVTLLHVRELVGAAGGQGPAVVSEMLDDRNRALAQVAQVDDVIVSDEIVSLMLSQLSEEARLEAVFMDLLDEEGSEIYLRPATDYVTEGGEVNFATIVESATRRGETAIGYRIAALARDAESGYGIRVNPAKAAVFQPDPADRVVVLAED